MPEVRRGNAGCGCRTSIWPIDELGQRRANRRAGFPDSPGYWEELPEADFTVDPEGESAEAVYVPIAEQTAGEQAAEPIAAVEEVQQWLRRTLKPKTDNVQFPQSLKDVVRIITCAHRLGVGDFVWLSWDGRMPTRRTHPSHAATAFAVTQLGARHVLNMMQQEVAPSHIDVLFRDRLIQNYWNGHLRT